MNCSSLVAPGDFTPTRHRFVSGLFWLALCFTVLLHGCSQPTSAPAPGPTGNAIAQANLAKATSMVIHLPDNLPPKVWEVETDESMTIKALMDALASAQFQFRDTLYPGMGHLVTSIMGIQNASGEGEYWQFCINNVASDGGVDEKQVAPGEQVDWHYSKYGELPCKKIGE
jgi:Domain of unknown function (DUF4430)